jgi:hypothetical protein
MCPPAQLKSEVTPAGRTASDRHVAAQSRVSFAARYGWHGTALIAAAVALSVHSLAVLVVRWQQPLLGMHAFRQTQTAITSYWMLKGSPWLAYETPVLGPPWSVPFEFPLFQLLVAGLVKVTGIALDPAGRLLSYFFLVLTIYPVTVLARSYRRDSGEVLVFVMVLLAAPLYLYWGTCFMIETFALFFSFAFVAAVDRAARTLHWGPIATASLCGTIAALGKITTFAAFYCIAAVILIYQLWERRRLRWVLYSTTALSAAVMLPPPIIFSVWTRFADAEKAKSPLSLTQISTNPHTRAFIFGSWSQLFSGRMLTTVGGDIRDTLGGALVPAILLVFLLLFRRHFNRLAVGLMAAAVAAFLFPFVIFTNLYIVHNYYYAENAVFLLCAVAIVIGTFFSQRQWVAGWGTLILVIGSQLLWFYGYFVRDITHPLYQRLLAIAISVKANTDPDGVVIIYGQEWSPVIPYYSERRALMEPGWMPMADAITRLHQVDSPIGGYPVEALVRCPSPRDGYPEYRKLFRSFDARLRKERIGGCDVYFIKAGSSSRAKDALPRGDFGVVSWSVINPRQLPNGERPTEWFRFAA